jgi:tetratricopeptide (TPR) repeat protein/predicted aspartyl protease
MPHRGWLIALLLTALSATPPPLAAVCKLQVAQMPVTMSRLRPLVHAQINGSDALFIADSGAFYNTLTRAAVDQFKLPLSPPPFGFVMEGVGGEAQAWLTHVKAFTLLGVPLHNTEFIVVGNELGEGAVGLLGQNVFRVFGDVEYDLANGVIRLVKTQDCRDSSMAYWAKSQPYSVIDIDYATPQTPHTTSTAFLNGAKIRVLFDTGAAASLLTLQAAKRAGVTPDSPGVVAAGASNGIGRRVVKTWIAPFSSFKIGDEQVLNTHLRIGAGTMLHVDMLIGADFFLSHRIYVANSQRKLYFTYNGGPVFNLTAGPAMADNSPAPNTTAPNTTAPNTTAPSGSAPSGSAPSGSAPNGPAPNGPAPNGPAPNGLAPGSSAPGNPAPNDAAAQPPAPPNAHADQPTDASGFARRGAAFASRHDFEHAVADLTRACELAPNEPGYAYQRGLAHWGNRQAELALADFDQALRLKPDYLPALVARADLHVRRKEISAAITDLDAADRVAPREASQRLQLADLYLFAGHFESAVAQETLWIDAHGWDDTQMPRARNLRCWTRALWGEELERALADCDTALKLRPDTAAFLDSRGLVQLRRGDYDRAIADYDRALRLGAKGAWSYYGRGVAKLRKGLIAGGKADIAAATALQAHIADEARERGITP